VVASITAFTLDAAEVTVASPSALPKEIRTETEHGASLDHS
jgi:hypothetical protein